MNKLQIEEIMRNLERKQKGCSARTIPEGWLHDMLLSLRWKPYFKLVISGGKVSNSYKKKAYGGGDSSQGVIMYDRKTGFLQYRFYRIKADTVPYGEGFDYSYIDDRWQCISSDRQLDLVKYMTEREKRKYPYYHIQGYYDDKYREVRFVYQLTLEVAGVPVYGTKRDKPYKTLGTERRAINKLIEKQLNHVWGEATGKEGLFNGVLTTPPPIEDGGSSRPSCERKWMEDKLL